MCRTNRGRFRTRGKGKALRWVEEPSKRGGEDYPALPDSPLSVARQERGTGMALRFSSKLIGKGQWKRRVPRRFDADGEVLPADSA